MPGELAVDTHVYGAAMRGLGWGAYSVCALMLTRAMMLCAW